MGVVSALLSRRSGPTCQMAGLKAFGPFLVAPIRPRLTRRSPRRHSVVIIVVFAIFFLLVAVPPLQGRGHAKKVASEDYGLGFSTEIAAPESEVVNAVEAVVNNGIIQGSKEYNKDRYIESASAAASSAAFRRAALLEKSPSSPSLVPLALILAARSAEVDMSREERSRP